MTNIGIKLFENGVERHRTMIHRAAFALATAAFASASTMPASAANPRTVFAQHDPYGRLPNTRLQSLGTIRVTSAVYSIYYLDFSNPVSLHGMQQIAIIKNGTGFAAAYLCTLGPDDGKLIIGKDRLTVKIFGMTFVIRFDENGPTRNSSFCGEGAGWRSEI